ncbi:hypothetical protein L8C07_06005 [Paenibacillus sp. CMAA1739]|uniref:hypothetical protein n=1 Tax=Paenibacillus ottowii TaxID=2315729 RepID=UPI002DBE0BF3|nr:hypothetical protein [Paenibacillus sp. CMAA1739]MEC4565493.1 hypothetical protein [Paenibacillus sp. CMAA1739]
MPKVALVKHNGSSVLYEFYTDLDLKKGDLVVCETHRGYETAKVVSCKERAECSATNWIVSKVDTKNHTERVQKEKRISYLKQQIDMRRNEFTDEYINELISLKDKAMYSLLKELNELTSKSNTKDEIELKDSFYFTTREVKCKADKCGNFYIITTPISYWQLQYSIEQVKEKFISGEWKMIDQ